MRAAICIFVTALLFVAGLFIANSCVKAVKEGEVISTSRKSSRLYRKEEFPVAFWISVSLHSLMAAGMIASVLCWSSPQAAFRRLDLFPALAPRSFLQGAPGGSDFIALAFLDGGQPGAMLEAGLACSSQRGARFDVWVHQGVMVAGRRVAVERWRGPAAPERRYARIGFTTLPWTSVRRKSRPWER
jgi:hypothetical protein